MRKRRGGRGVLLPQGQPASAPAVAAPAARREGGEKGEEENEETRPVVVVVGKLGVVWVQKS